MPATIEELRAEIDRLERENRDLKSRSKSPSTILTSIEGLETFAMRIVTQIPMIQTDLIFVDLLTVYSANTSPERLASQVTRGVHTPRRRPVANFWKRFKG
jgi:hypothetical protein